MELIFRKPIARDKDKIDRFLILIKDDYVPSFTEQKQRIIKELKQI